LRIAIEGAGVGGSYLYYLLSEKERNVDLYDSSQWYYKACGEAVPNIYVPKFPWKVIDEIHDFSFILDDKELGEISYRRPKWVIIDKSGWINSMREAGTSFIKGRLVNRSKYDIIIRAYGPYDTKRETVTVVRAIVEASPSEHKGVIFEFDSRFSGFYWIFPSQRGFYNVGGGFIGIKNPVEAVMQYIKRMFKQSNVLDLRGAPLTIGGVKNRELRIGEARGLVYPLTGEGIRPAAISAEHAFEAIEGSMDIDAYLEKKLASLQGAIAFQRNILRIYSVLPARIRQLAFRHLVNSEHFLDNYLVDEISPLALI
jgi:flavin-dependent dehydrogenase